MEANFKLTSRVMTYSSRPKNAIPKTKYIFLPSCKLTSINLRIVKEKKKRKEVASRLLSERSRKTLLQVLKLVIVFA